VREAERSRKVAVVTGGAAGIGQAFARRLAHDGHAVAIADRASSDETQSLVRDAGAEVFAGRCDVSDPESVAAFAQSVSERLGRVEILIHNAGIYPLGAFKDTDWATWRRIMDVNLDSLFHLTKAFLPGMEEAGWGRVVAMASVAFHSGSPGAVAYAASKGGVIGFVRSLAAEVGEHGITSTPSRPASSEPLGPSRVRNRRWVTSTPSWPRRRSSVVHGQRTLRARCRS
jgi:NAD(P)-dependent dehydrogenase (short-subunit alcohol dehydrogenase family)